MASQALWRVEPKGCKGLDATFGYDWSPADINRNNTLLAAGLRFNEPLPANIHNTMSLGYVRNSLSPEFLPSGQAPWRVENAIEFNTLLDPETLDPSPGKTGLKPCRTVTLVGRWTRRPPPRISTRVS